MTTTKPARPGRPVSLEKRSAMLEAGVDEFGESGYDNASMDAIAARAGVSKRTLYNHFQSKEGLFSALVEEVGRRISVSATLAYVPEEPLRAQLLRFAAESRRLLRNADNLRLISAVLAEHIRHPERVEPLLDKYWRSEYGLLDWMKAARADRRLRGDPQRLAHVCGALIKSILFWPTLIGRRDPETQPLHDEVSEAVDMFLAYYAAPGS